MYRNVPADNDIKTASTNSLADDKTSPIIIPVGVVHAKNRMKNTEDLTFASCFFKLIPSVKASAHLCATMAMKRSIAPC